MLRRLQIALYILAASIGVRTGFAQSIFHYPVTPEELTRIKENLNLNPDQIKSIDMLYDSGSASFQKKSMEIRALRKRFFTAFEKDIPDEERDPADLQLRLDFGNSLREFRAMRVELDRTVMRDFEGLLTDEQREKWPAVIRAHRRYLLGRTDTRGTICWGNVDLIETIQSLELNPQDYAVIAPLMDEYALDMDRILQPLEQAVWKDMRQEGDDFRKAAWEAGDKAATLNRKYCRIITDTETFSAAGKERLFNEVYRQAYFEIYGNLNNDDAALMQQALQLPDLTIQQVEALAALDDKWYKDLNDFYRRSRETYDRAYIAVQKLTPEEYLVRLQDPKDPEVFPFPGIETDFKALVTPYGETMRKILTPEQKAILWPPPAPAPEQLKQLKDAQRER